MDTAVFAKKQFYVAVAVITVNLAVLVLGGWWLSGSISSASSQLTEKKGILKEMQSSWGEIMSSQKDLKEKRPGFEKVQLAYVSLQQPIEFIKYLEELAKSSGNLYEINLMTVGQRVSELAPDKENEKSLLFQITTAGSYDNFMHLVKYLENGKYYMNVEAISVGLSKNGSWTDVPAGSVYGQINLRAFAK